MKITFGMLLLSLWGSVLLAQVSLEKTYNYSTSVVHLESRGYMYYLMDVPNSECRIYNPDHSLYKTIHCPVPERAYLADLKFISEKLFDEDDGIELAYTWYMYVPVQSSYYYDYGSKIINDDGSVVATIDGAQYLYINPVSDNEVKLFAYCYDYSVFPEKVWTNIYNLPGSQTSEVAAIVQPDPFLRVYPNPAETELTIDYLLPADANQARIFITNIEGSILETFTAMGPSGRVVKNISSYQPGIYLYYLESNNQRIGAGRLVVK